MDWLAEIWKWIDANLDNWFLVLWWFTLPVFLLSAFGRWWAWRRWSAAGGGERRGLRGGVRIMALAVTASWRGDWKRLAAPLAVRGKEPQFLVAAVTAHVLPVYALLIIFALGKEYLLVYLIAVAMFLAAVALAGAALLEFPQGEQGKDEGSPPPDPPFWTAPVREVLGVAPRFVYGLVLAGVLAAVAIHPEWTFPVEITGAGVVAQTLNAVFGVVLAVGAWTPPVGAFLFAVPVWRGGFALAGLLAFLLAVPAAPQALIAYAQWLGRREAAKIAALVLAAAIASGVAAAALVGLSGLDLPYVYSPDQLLRWQ